jgi:outer membrane protein assembly factor BamE (lipoprotein component of BamABCDE complex)
MRSDADRLQFLALDNFDERNQWLTSHGVYGSDTPNKPEIQALIEINDITVGMTKQAVRDSWGEPELVEVAGNPLYGNERWGYSEQLPSSEGFQSEKRIVYFEGGRVIGWERH